jgi:hypothetical protein
VQDREGLADPERFQAARLRIGSEQHNGVRAGKPAGAALAQRACRDHPSVPEAIHSIDDEERQGLGDPGVLKSVVEHDDLRSGRHCGADAVDSVARHPARRLRGKQERLVADRCGIVAARVDPHRSAEAAAVTTRHEMHRDAARDEGPGQRQCHRGLAGAAGDQIADAHHWDRRAIGAGKRVPQPARHLPARPDRQ